MHAVRVLIPTIVTFVTGIVLIAAFFIPHEPFRTFDRDFSTWFDIVAAFAFILGGGNLLRMHGDRVYRRHKDRLFSLVTVVGFLVTLFVGVFKIRYSGPHNWAAAVDENGTVFQFIYDSMFDPLSAAMFSLLAFFVASASFRAFRAKTPEATLLLLAAFVILLGRTFIGSALGSWLPSLSAWIMTWPNAAGQRAIMIGIALGIISTSLKLILGIERSHLGGGGEGG